MSSLRFDRKCQCQSKFERHRLIRIRLAMHSGLHREWGSGFMHWNNETCPVIEMQQDLFVPAPSGTCQVSCRTQSRGSGIESVLSNCVACVSCRKLCTITIT